jgi:hypothetical protein
MEPVSALGRLFTVGDEWRGQSEQDMMARTGVVSAIALVVV